MTVTVHLYQNDTTMMPGGVPLQLLADGALVARATTAETGVASFDYDRNDDETLTVRFDLDTLNPKK